MKLKRIKREEAVERAASRAKRTDKQQLERISAKGHGHSKEAKRLDLSIAALTNKKSATVSKPVKV